MPTCLLHAMSDLSPEPGHDTSDLAAWQAVVGARIQPCHRSRCERAARGERGAHWHWPPVLITWYWLVATPRRPLPPRRRPGPHRPAGCRPGHAKTPPGAVHRVAWAHRLRASACVQARAAGAAGRCRAQRRPTPQLGHCGESSSMTSTRSGQCVCIVPAWPRAPGCWPGARVEAARVCCSLPPLWRPLLRPNTRCPSSRTLAGAKSNSARSAASRCAACSMRKKQGAK